MSDKNNTDDTKKKREAVVGVNSKEGQPAAAPGPRDTVRINPRAFLLELDPDTDLSDDRELLNRSEKPQNVRPKAPEKQQPRAEDLSETVSLDAAEELKKLEKLVEKEAAARPSVSHKPRKSDNLDQGVGDTLGPREPKKNSAVRAALILFLVLLILIGLLVALIRTQPRGNVSNTDTFQTAEPGPAAEDVQVKSPDTEQPVEAAAPQQAALPQHERVETAGRKEPASNAEKGAGLDLTEFEKELAELEKQVSAAEEVAAQPEAGTQPAAAAATPKADEVAVDAGEHDPEKVRLINEFIIKHAKDKNVRSLAALIESSSERAGLDPLLITAMMAAESAFDAKAVSAIGKTGLLQIHPVTEEKILKASGFTKGDLFDSEYSLRLGVWYLNFLLQKYQGNYSDALTAYEMGFENFDKVRADRTGIPPLTARYLENIQKFYRELSGKELTLTTPPAQPEVAAKELPAQVVKPADEPEEVRPAGDAETKSRIAAFLAPTVVPVDKQPELAEAVVSEASRTGLDSRLLAAVIMAESSFNSTAKAEDGKIGLMQIHPDRAAAMAAAVNLPWSDPEQLKDDAYNLRLGSSYLAYSLKKQPNLAAGLLMYNLGEDEAAALLSKTKETSPLAARYLENVKSYMRSLGAAVPE